ncbi:MAG: hypothetical protein M3521_03925, partial [Acidobacteriota bacterium]|nr:hypothetical protein [Acidobacteriota bacterium]
ALLAFVFPALLLLPGVSAVVQPLKKIVKIENIDNIKNRICYSSKYLNGLKTKEYKSLNKNGQSLRD